MLIGAMKSGTTTLYHYLCRHSKIFMCSPKEPQFFSKDVKYEQGISWYRSLFAGAAPHQLAGEASACYTRWPEYPNVPERIAARFPNLKFLYIMRHPADRTYSHYRHLMAEREILGLPLMPLADALVQFPELTETSCYLKQINRFLEFYPRDRFLFLTTDDLKREPAEVLLKTQRFLGLPAEELVGALSLKANRAGSRIAYRKMDALISKLRHTKALSALVSLVPVSMRRKSRQFLTGPLVSSLAMRSKVKAHGLQVSPFDPAIRARLLERLAGPNRELEVFLKRDLSAWNR